jgi:UDP-N-acetylmuramate dehydrogenase
MNAAIQLRGELKENEALSRYTSWRVGGEAKAVYRPVDAKDLSTFLGQLPEEEPVLWLGLGSNLLIRDGGFNGTVIVTAGALQDVSIDEQCVSAQVGVYCSKLAKTVAKAGLQGLAFLAGIPGTLGGALAMNAGAHGSETWDFVTSIQTIDKRGVIHTRAPSEFDVSYRHVASGRDEWFIGAEMTLQPGDVDSEMALIKELLRQRNVSQPTNQPCAGSVFRNPENDHAGRLIEVTGLKGLTIGGASVSTKHANFIVNDGSATAADIENLIRLVQEKVQAEQGVTLTPEVHMIGETLS